MAIPFRLANHFSKYASDRNGTRKIKSERNFKSITYTFIENMINKRPDIHLINLYRGDGMQMTEATFYRRYNEIVTTLSNLGETGTNLMQIRLEFRKL